MTTKIHGMKWTIRLEPEEKMEELETSYLGLTHFISQLIQIRSGMSPELTRQTVIHELTHAFLFAYGIKEESYDEEKVCDFNGCHLDEILAITDKFMKGNTSC